MYFSYSPINSNKDIEQVYQAVLKFNQDRFLSALEFRHYDEYTIVKMKAEVVEANSIIEKELNNINIFAQSFNQEFVTHDNKRFSTVFQSLKQIKRGIGKTKGIFRKFCPRQRRESISHTIGNIPVSPFNYSYICKESYQLDFLKLEGVPLCVSELYYELECFFLKMVCALKLCLQVLKDEERIRKDNGHCYFLFLEYKKKTLKEITAIIDDIPITADYLSPENNTAIASRMNYSTDEEWAPHGFHNFSTTEMKYLLINDIKNNPKFSDIPTYVLLLFDRDEDKARKGYYLIRNFDQLILDNSKHKTIPGKEVYLFFQYFGFPESMSRKQAIDTFNKIYSQSQLNRCQPVKYSTVLSWQSKIGISDTDNFRDKINNLHIQSDELKLASNQ